MKHSLADYARAMYELLDRSGMLSGNPWAYRPCTERISIGALVSPLRLDILVRAEFFDFCAHHLDLFAQDFPRFYRLACEQPYYLWYRNVNCVRFSPHSLRNEEKLHWRFEKRIRSAVALYRDVRQNGFDQRRPIILQSAETIGPTSTGKRVSRQVFPGDGCHRIAVLASMGYTFLEPEACKIKYSRTLTPLDNTALLLRCLSIGREEYSAFLSLGYTGEVMLTEKELLAQVRRDDPDRALEVENILAIDGAILTEREHEQKGNEGPGHRFSVIKHVHRLSGRPLAPRPAR